MVSGEVSLLCLTNVSETSYESLLFCLVSLVVVPAPSRRGVRRSLVVASGEVRLLCPVNVPVMSGDCPVGMAG